MLRIIVICAVTLLAFALAAAGQGSDKAELAALRAALGVSDTEPITTSTTAPLPNAEPLKVFIATGKEQKVRDNFLRWIEEWNGGTGKKYGPLEVVENLSDADVAVVRLLVPRVEIIPVENTDLASVHHKYEPGPRISTTTIAVPIEYYSSMPVRSYLIVRSPGGLTVVWAHEGYSLVKLIGNYVDGGSEAERLRVAGDNLRKATQGKRETKETFEGKAGDYLRDKFFQMLKARRR